jgi:hypothetical protein
MHARFENECAVSEERAEADFRLTFFKRLTAQVDHHEFAMWIFAPGDDFAASDTGRQTAPGSIAEGCERQSSGLATHPVSGRLVRLGLKPSKTQRRASGVLSLGGVR